MQTAALWSIWQTFTFTNIIAGHPWCSCWIAGKPVFCGLLHPLGGGDGHAGPHQLHGQLHPLLHHVKAVQNNFQQDFQPLEDCFLPEK